MSTSVSAALARVTSLAEVLSIRAALQPDRVAYRFLADGERESSSCTYASLQAEVSRVAAALRVVAAPGSRVVLLYPQGPEFVVAFFACLAAGVVAVPAYLPGSRKSMTDRITAILRDADASVIATTAALLPTLVARGLGDAHPLQWLATDTVPADTPGLCDPPPGGDALALLQYTSGSTGAPKGVMVTHGNLLANTTYVRTAFALSPESVSVTWLPSFHDMGLVDGLLQPVAGGCLGVVMPPLAFLARPVRWLEAITRYRGTHSGGPNFAYDLLVRKVTDAELPTLDLSSWRSAYNGAEPVRAEVVRRFADRFASAGLSSRAMYPCYGMAEATLMISGGFVDESVCLTPVDGTALDAGTLRVVEDGAPRERLLVGCGRTWLDTRVVIADPDSRAALPEGRVGEIWVQGSSVARGYWQQPEATAATFGAVLVDGRGPFLRTGDLGVWHQGELYVTGRLKDVVILRGQNHYPQDLEAAAMAAHPSLRPDGVAAFAVDAAEGERLVLVAEVERHARATLDVDAIAEAVRAAVFDASEARVDHLVLIQSGTLPKTSSGKVQRRQCREAYVSGALRVVGESRASDPSVDSSSGRIDVSTIDAARDGVRQAAARVLGVRASALDVAQPLATAGLDSLRAVELAALVGQWSGREVPPTLVYDYPTVDALAGWLVHPEATTPRWQRPVRAAVPVAIVGMACRFPGASSPEAFWSLLSEGRSAITAVPRERWDADALERIGIRARWAGLVEGIDGCDAAFFGLSGREADRLDPQHRLLLETAWECLERAGWSASALAGTAGGVFVGISSQDYFRRQVGLPVGDADLYSGTGNALSVAANRLSYLLDWTGPSLAVDTACSSSLSAVHLACRALGDGECDVALAGGVNVLLDPALSAAFSRSQMLAGDGRVKAFDASADGYVRGEGCGLVLLKRLDEAERDGDRVLAVIRGSAMNQDGRSQGLTAPNGQAQQAVIRRALASATIEPHAIGYVEAHGTGTVLGDPIEMAAIVRTLGDQRQDDAPCVVGSVKTNIGHLEAAAGIAGLIKTTLILQHGRIPKHLHLQQRNPLLSMMDGTPFRIPAANQDWPSTRPRVAGVSAFGFGGTNVHVVLEGGPSVPPVTDRDDDEHAAPRVLVFSARTPTALEALAARYASTLESPDVSWAGVCATAAHGRVWWPERLAVVAHTAHEAAAHLRAGQVVRGRAIPAQAAEGTVGADVQAVAESWVRGTVSDPRVVAPDPRPRVLLPTYPFERRRHWALTQAPEMDPMAAWMHVQTWQPRPLGDGARSLPAHGRWYVIGRPTPLRAALVAGLQQRGAQAMAISDDPALGTWPRMDGAAGVVVLAPDEVFDRVPVEAGEAALDEVLRRAYAPALAAVQAFVSAGATGQGRVWLVTRGAVAGAGVSADGWGAALLHGFGRSVAQEAGEVAGGLVDLDPEARDVDREVEALIAEALAHPPGPPIQVAYRSGRRLMPRLVVAERRLAPPDVRADATYLITGGSGAVGVAIARALAARGARHLWLASRRGTVPSDLQRDLDAAGVRVQAAAVDVTTRHAVWALIDDISRSGPPLAGIVHAAGIAVDGTVPKQTVESWLAVARPKVLGAWFLHEATRGRRLDWFLLVSSAAGLLGSPGQANYAAANAWLAGLAAWRRAQGLPAQALAFGPWRSTGLAAVDGADRRSAALGMALLEPADAACAWWTAVQVDAPEVGIWPAVEAAPERQTGVARAAVSRVPDARRRVLVDEHVCRIVASVLQLDPAVAVDRHRGFLDMGLDSLMAVDLKRRFEEEFAVSVPMTLAFDHPTVDAVVTWLLSQITVGEDGAVAAAPTAPAQTSDADLARELGDLERWLQ